MNNSPDITSPTPPPPPLGVPKKEIKTINKDINFQFIRCFRDLLHPDDGFPRRHHGSSFPFRRNCNREGSICDTYVISIHTFNYLWFVSNFIHVYFLPIHRWLPQTTPNLVVSNVSRMSSGRVLDFQSNSNFECSRIWWTCIFECLGFDNVRNFMCLINTINISNLVCYHLKTLLRIFNLSNKWIQTQIRWTIGNCVIRAWDGVSEGLKRFDGDDEDVVDWILYCRPHMFVPPPWFAMFELVAGV